jgi:hypothetical protein
VRLRQQRLPPGASSGRELLRDAVLLLAVHLVTRQLDVALAMDPARSITNHI